MRRTIFIAHPTNLVHYLCMYIHVCSTHSFSFIIVLRERNNLVCSSKGLVQVQFGNTCMYIHMHISSFGADFNAYLRVFFFLVKLYSDEAVSLNDFKIIRVLGTGGK